MVVAIIVTLIALIGSDLAQWLRYDRVAILNGEYWRVVSGHFVHLSWSHLGMNVAGLLLVWFIFGGHLPWGRWIIILLAGALGVSALLLYFNPQLRWYVGLSGILHTLFIAGCLADLKFGRWDTWILLILVILKLGYEQLMGPLPGSESTAGGNVIVDAHLYGAIFGVVMMVFYWLRKAGQGSSPV